MLRRSSLTLIVVSALVLPLFSCGNPSSDQASTEATQGDETTVDGGADTEGATADAEDEASADEGDEAAQDASGDDREQVRPRRASGASDAVATRDIGAGVRGDIGMFYDDLAQDGAWVYHPDYSYVWIPSRMGPGWRPYQEGHWIWTDAYGWYWESDEPFGWAVYHYGRWDYDPDYGWFWVPGDTWAPAWVTWRFGGDVVGWAPIAPDRPGFASGPPRRYAPPIAESWVFVDARDFTAPDVAPYVLPISRIGPSLGAATDIRTPRYQNGRVVNFGAPRDEVQRFARGPIQSRELVYVGNPNQTFDDVRGRRAGIYRPVIADGGARRKPSTVVEVTKSGRVIVREYAPVGGRYDVPSAALLDVLDQSERKGLLETRLTAKEAAVDQRLEQLRQQRAALLKQRQEEAAKLEAKLEKERKKAMAERRRNHEALREAKRQRADDVKLDAGAAETPKQETTPAAASQPAPAVKAIPEAAPAPKRAKPEPASEPAPEQEAVAPPAASAQEPREAVAPVPPAAAPMPPAAAPVAATVPPELAPVPQPQGAADEASPRKRKGMPPQDAEAPAAPAAPPAQPEMEAPPAAAEQMDAPAPPQGQGQRRDGAKKQERTAPSPEESSPAPPVETPPQLQPQAPASEEPQAAPVAPE
jgi:Family of unknown function (DUF6600)